MNEPVEAVLFDIDDTLCVYRRSGEKLLAEGFEREGIEPFFQVTEYYDRFEEFAGDYDSIDELRAACFATIADERGRDPAVGRALGEHYAAARDHREVVFLPGAREAVDALGEEYVLGVVTNGGPDSQRPKLEGLGVADAFETVVYAGFGVAPKPDPAPFHRALDALGVRPERAVHVGNSLDADVAGAHAAGLRSVWVPNGPEATGRANDETEAGNGPDHTLDTLFELTPPPWH